MTKIVLDAVKRQLCWGLALSLVAFGCEDDTDGVARRRAGDAGSQDSDVDTPDASLQDAAVEDTVDAGDLDAGSPSPSIYPNVGESYLPRVDGKMEACTEGIEIYYQIWRYAGAAEATLVFVNGRAEYTDKYHHLVNLFDRPWDIIMYDHMGQGRSDGTRAHADDFDTQFVCDLKKIVDEQASPSLPLAIAAHSLGGYVTARFAELYPDEAQVLVLSAPMFGIELPEGMTAEDAKALGESMIAAGQAEEPTGLTNTERPACEENVHTHDCEIYNYFKDDPLTQIGEPTWGFGYSMVVGYEKLFADAAKITKPVLIMHGSLEQVVQPERHVEFCDLLGEELCTLVVFENDYHELFVESDRAEVVKTAAEFIDANLTP